MASRRLPSTPVWVRVWFGSKQGKSRWFVSYGAVREIKDGDVMALDVIFFVPARTMNDASTPNWTCAVGAIECFGVLIRTGDDIEIRRANTADDD